MGYKVEISHTRNWCFICHSPIHKGAKMSRVVTRWAHLACKEFYLREAYRLEDQEKV